MARDLGPLVLSFGADARGFRAGLSDVQKQLQSFGATMNVVGFRMSAAFAASFGALSVFSLKVGTDFETAMAGVRKTVDPTTTDFDILSESLLNAAVSTGIAASELANLTRIGGQLGVEGTKNLAKFTATIAKLSIAAAELTPEAAARGLARLVALTGESIGDVDKLASTLAFLGDKLPTTEERILNFSVLLGGMAKAADLSGEQLLGIAAGFSAVVPGTERASTAVQRLIQQMIEATAQGGAKLEEFGKVLKISGEDFQTLFAKDSGEAIAQFIEGLARLKSEGSDKLFTSLKNLELQNLRTVQTLLAAAGASGLFRSAIDAATKDTDRHLKLEREFTVQLATVAAQFNILKRVVEEVGITLFRAFKDEILLIIHAGKSLVGFLQTMADSFATLPGAVKIATIGVITLTGAFAGLLIVMGTMGGALIGAVSLVRQAGTAFATFATQVKSLAVVQALAGTSAQQITLPFTNGAVAVTRFGGSLGKVLPALKGIAGVLPTVAQGVGAVGVGILVGVAATDKMPQAALKLQGGTDDLAKQAVANAGIFAKSWEGTKQIVITGFQTLGNIANWWVGVIKAAASNFVTSITTIGKIGISVLAQIGGAFKIIIGAVGGFVGSMIGAGNVVGSVMSTIGNTVPLQLLAKGFETLKTTIKGAIPAFDQLGDMVTIAAEQYLTMIGQFPDPNADPITAAMRYQAEALGVVIKEGEKGLALATRLGAALKAQAKAFRESAEGQKQAADAAKVLRESNLSMIEGFRAAGEEAASLSALSKHLNISQEQLTEAIKEQGPSFRILATNMMEADKAAKDYQKSIEGLVTTSAEVEAKNKLVIAAIKDIGGAAKLSRGEVERLAPTFIAMANAGEKLAKAQKEVVARFIEMKGQSASTTGRLKELTDAAKLQMQIIVASGGPFAAHNDALAEAAKAFKAAEAAGKTLTKTEEFIVELYENEVKALNDKTAATDKSKEATEKLASSIDDLRNSSGLMTEGATAAFENFFNTITTISGELGPELSEGFKEAIKGMAKTLIEEFPALENKIKELLGNIGESLGEGAVETVNWDKQVKSLAATFRVLGIDASSAVGLILAAFTATGKFVADIQKQLTSLGDMKNIFSQEGLNAGLALGTSVVGAFGSFWQASGKGGVAGILAATLAGAKIGSIFGPWGTAIGAGIGALVAVFRNKFSKVEGNLQQIVAATGAHVGEALRKSIEQTAKDLDLSIWNASLLHLTESWEETGGILSIGLDEAGAAMNRLLVSLTAGSIPAGAALKQLSEGIAMMGEIAVVAGRVADDAFLDLVQNIKNRGIEIKEITDFILSQIEQAATGLQAIVGPKIEIGEGSKKKDVFGGIQIVDPQQAQAQADIFAAVFFATLETAGLRAAIETLGPAFDILKEKIKGFGDVDLGGMERFFNLAKDPQFGPLLDGVQGLSDVLAGLANAGFLTKDAFNALQIQGLSAFDQLTAAGLTEAEALQQMAPLLQNMIDAANRYGFAIDQDTQNLIDQAKEAGIAFSTDPLIVMADAITLIAELLGASEEQLASLGKTAVTAGGDITESLGNAGETVGDTIDDIGTGGEESFKDLGESAKNIFKGVG